MQFHCSAYQFPFFQAFQSFIGLKQVFHARSNQIWLYNDDPTHFQLGISILNHPSSWIQTNEFQQMHLIFSQHSFPYQRLNSSVPSQVISFFHSLKELKTFYLTKTCFLYHFDLTPSFLRRSFLVWQDSFKKFIWKITAKSQTSVSLYLFGLAIAQHLHCAHTLCFILTCFSLRICQEANQLY